MILLSLLACADPEPAALTACQALPGLATDAAGLALLEPVLVSSELTILRTAAPTRGLEVVGSEGLAALRGQTQCAVTANNAAGSGRWAITLSRTLPSVRPDGSLGEPHTQTLAWQVVDEGGLRVETGLGVADSMRRSIASAVEEGDHARVASSFRALERTYGDPLLSVDLAEAAAVEEAWRYRSQLDGWVESVGSDAITVAVDNQGERDVAGADLTVTFTVGGEKSGVPVRIGAVEAGGVGRIQVAIPEGAEGKVTVKTDMATF